MQTNILFKSVSDVYQLHELGRPYPLSMFRDPNLEAAT